MKRRGLGKREELPLLYHKTREDIEAYRKKPIEQKLRWLESQMEFFHKLMSPKAKRIRDKLRKPGLELSIRDLCLSKGVRRKKKQSKR